MPRTRVNWAVRVPDTLQQQPSTPQNAATSMPQNAATLTPDPSPHIQNHHQQQTEIMFDEDFEDEQNDLEGVIPIQMTPQKTLSSVSPLKILQRKRKKNSQAKRKRPRRPLV